MKKFLALVISLLMVAAVSGCKQSDETPSNAENPVKPDTPVNPDTPPADDSPFTVSLEYDGQPFIPTNGMTAVWTAVDGSGISSPAEFDTEGVATAREELDGEYTVSISPLPAGYTYNPNIYTVSNAAKRAVIELYRIMPVTGNGTDLYTHIMRLSSLGAYRITIEEQGQEVYCQYEPRGGGVFAIETIVDAAANDINPRMDVYVGSTQYKPSRPTYSLNDGGISSVYTKNVKYEVSITAGNIYAFAVKCDSNIGYPVNIDLLVTRNGDINAEPETKYTVVEPDETFYDAEGNPKTAPDGRGTMRYAYTVVGGRKILDGTRVTRGEDGFYYYKKSNGISVPLYAKIRTENELVDFQTDLVNLYFDGKNYNYLIRGYDALQQMLPATDENKELLDRLKDKKTYYDCCNRDGAYPVNDQLKEFLKGYSVNNRFFFDGWGWAEGEGYDSNDDDQWLYGCIYYD